MNKKFSILMWLYIVINTTTKIILSNSVGNLLQVLLILWMFLYCLWAVRFERFTVDKIFIYYCLLLFTALIPDFLSGELLGFRIGITLFIPVVLYFLFVNVYKGSREVPLSIISIPIIYGVLQSALGIFLVILSYFVDNSNAFFAAFWQRGFIQQWGNFHEKDIYRVYGFYIEPSKFAAFLILPLLFLMGLYRKTRKKSYLIEAAIIFLCFILTLSRAGYISLLASVIFYLVIHRKRKQQMRTKIFDLFRLFAFAISFLVLALGVLNLFFLLSKRFPDAAFLQTGIFNKSGEVSLLRPETVDLDYILPLLKRQPFGYGLSHSSHGIYEIDTNLANAFVHWMFTGGMGAVLIMVLLMGELFFHYCIPCAKSKDPIKNSAALAFVALTVHNLSYGLWATADYMFVVGFMVLIRERDLTMRHNRRGS